MTDKTEKLKSFPVYIPPAKYKEFQKLCKADRQAMTKIAEAEIDKYIKRKTAS